MLVFLVMKGACVGRLTSSRSTEPSSDVHVCILLIGCPLILVLCFHVSGSLSLGEIDEGLLVFLLLPFIKAVSQDETALSFQQRILNEVVHKHSLIHGEPSLRMHAVPVDELCGFHVKMNPTHSAPCRTSLGGSRCNSCWCCTASCLGHCCQHPLVHWGILREKRWMQTCLVNTHISLQAGCK